MRPAPLRRARRAIRSWRARPHRGLSGPLLLALALAGTGQYVSAQADAASSVATVATVETSSWSGTSLRDEELLAALRAPRPVAKPVAKKTVAAKAPARSRTPQRASRSTARAPKATGRWVRPCAGAMTSAYGQRWGRMHRGIDLCGRHGVLVVAAGDGVVIHAGQGLSGYGNQIQIRHTDGSVSSYSHLSAFLVRGGRVSAGTPIGRTGSTGNVTGPHLHLEIKVGGVHVDPQSFLRRHGVSI
jgi:murein DD-endopeptidase MepM/ murein hydrolase activator NlpD